MDEAAVVWRNMPHEAKKPRRSPWSLYHSSGMENIFINWALDFERLALRLCTSSTNAAPKIMKCVNQPMADNNENVAC